MVKLSFDFVKLEKDGKKELSEAYTDEQITQTIDHVLELMDKDKDGYINYSEFMTNNQPGPEAPKPS